MADGFFDNPILNSPYEEPRRHHALSEEGQPLNLPPKDGRRRSELISPVPPAKKQKKRDAQSDWLQQEDEEGQAYTLQNINEIRTHVSNWRRLPNPADWGVTPVTQRLLQYWRHHNFETVRPFFCQVEAVETAIWLTEVAPRQKQHAHLVANLRQANHDANPELLRTALKLATGAGKTTVMAMLIAWQTLNAVRAANSDRFSRAFLIVAPGITIRDRLQILQPSHPDNYYARRELVPQDLLPDMAKAKVVIANYHVFKRRETMELSKVGRAFLQGRDEPIQTLETEGAMLKRACGELLAFKNVVVINDEAHHCYRERTGGDAEAPVAAEEREEAKRNAEAARLWISGLEALKRKVGVRMVYDLSATPFFLRGSGYREGTLFPWTVSDFSLMDAIECGIVKLPRIPVADNAVTGDAPIYRELWEHIGKRMPKKGAGKSGDLDPLSASFPPELQTALYALYSHYQKTYDEWQRAGIDTPPVFIVVCNNTATSKLVYEWIAGFERPGEDGELEFRHAGHLELFRNYDQHGNRLTRFNTLLVDSEALEAGEALDASYRDLMGSEIEQFKRELRDRGLHKEAENLSDTDVLREVMNTVGRKGRLGEQIRCVVSVSMLTEGWDANTVTHIMGVRAFGTQLLCEQVVGRGLRRQSYELNKEGLFDVEYADILGIPFNFTAEPVVAPVKKPAKSTRVQALKERLVDKPELEIVFPRVEGYRYDLPDETIAAHFTDDSRFELNPGNVGPSKVQNEGVVGEGVTLTPEIVEAARPSELSFKIAKRLLYTRYRDEGQDPPMHLFGQLQRIARRWITEGYLTAKGVPLGSIMYPALEAQAAELIFMACQRANEGEARVKAILDSYNPRGSTRFVAFNTTKSVWTTRPDKSHVSHVVMDSEWEGELARVLEDHPKVVAYVKNQGLQFEVPYRDGAVARRYVPDFIVRLDDGGDEPLNLILETKGYRGVDAQLKAETMKTLWVPGVNALGAHGRWAFAEFTEPYGMEEAFAALVESMAKTRREVTA